MTTNDVPTKRVRLAKNIWIGQGVLAVVAVELLVLFGAQALGVMPWVGPILLLVISFVGMRYIFTMDYRGMILAGAAAAVLILGMLFI